MSTLGDRMNTKPGDQTYIPPTTPRLDASYVKYGPPDTTPPKVADTTQHSNGG